MKMMEESNKVERQPRIKIDGKIDAMKLAKLQAKVKEKCNTNGASREENLRQEQLEEKIQRLGEPRDSLRKTIRRKNSRRKNKTRINCKGI
jgi:predicted hydrolase (HD superfamily)